MRASGRRGWGQADLRRAHGARSEWRPGLQLARRSHRSERGLYRWLFRRDAGRFGRGPSTPDRTGASEKLLAGDVHRVRRRLAGAAAESLEPSWFAYVFLIETPQTRGQHLGTAEVTDDLAVIGAIDYRQTSNVIAQHLFGSLIQG